MKVKLEIEFEMNTELEESDIVKTKTELLNGIRLVESDVVDGFEITTDFDECDNTSDFFIKPYSARIISIEAPEFSKKELCAEDIDVEEELIINDDGVSVNAYLGTYFEPNEVLGTDIDDSGDEFVNLYADYNSESGELSVSYYVVKRDREYTEDYDASESEKEMILNLMETACQKQNGCSLDEFVQNCQESEDMTLGGMS